AAAPGAAFDDDLNGPQLDAVARALAARDVALIHGPPGTGKTRTLVEVIRRAVAQGARVLATAASNTAVDNLAERLAAAGAELVRLGHPAGAAPAVEHVTLDALLEASEAYALARRWRAEARALLRRGDRAQKAEARALLADARRHLEGEQARIL